jgi:hypothetical protein
MHHFCHKFDVISKKLNLKRKYLRKNLEKDLKDLKKNLKEIMKLVIMTSFYFGGFIVLMFWIVLWVLLINMNPLSFSQIMFSRS